MINSTSYEKFKEEEMYYKGVERFDRNYNRATEKGSITDPERSFMAREFQNVLKSFTERAERKVKYRPTEEWQIDALKVGLPNCVFAAFHALLWGNSRQRLTADSNNRTSKKELSVTSLAEEIGLTALAGTDSDGDYKRFTESQDSINKAIRLGWQIIQSMVETENPLISIVGTERLSANMNTQATVEWSEYSMNNIAEIYEDMRYAKPHYSPMVVPPRSVLEGSYYDEKIASRHPLSSARAEPIKKLIRDSAVMGADWLRAVDIIQSVPLMLNKDVLRIVKQAQLMNTLEFNRENKDKYRPFSGLPPSANLPVGLSKKEIREYKSLQGTFTGELIQATEYANEDTIYLPAFVDFRGRVYAVPKLNHQSVDWMKSLWLFAEGKPIDTKEAGDWLKIHLANCGDFNKIAKQSFADRIKWVDDNHDRIMKFALDPFEDPEWFYGTREVDGADAPFCFVAACMEYRKWQTQGADYVCHLPVAVDGSCSGLQHFSAMARDEFTGQAVNLVPMDKPQDIYQRAADLLIEILKVDEDPMAKEWLDFGVSRKTTKRATMTLCYGSRKGGMTKNKATRKMDLFGWSEQLMVDIVSGKESRFTDPLKACTYLAGKLDVVLRQIAPKPMEVMDWLQKVAGVLAKFNKTVSWTTNAGFPVVNAYYKQFQAECVIVEKGRATSMRYNYGNTGEVVPMKQRNSISPNFVHSWDAAHLHQTALKAIDYDIYSYLLIHDSFSCLPADMEKFHKLVTKAFVEQYLNFDPIKELYLKAIKDIGVEYAHLIPKPPTYGSLDLAETIHSNYAFA